MTIPEAQARREFVNDLINKGGMTEAEELALCEESTELYKFINGIK